MAVVINKAMIINMAVGTVSNNSAETQSRR
jgi:hypothetical protein